MESNKHNDDLIKRKLDSIRLEPRKLNFTKLDTNYQKAKRRSSTKWKLLFIVLGITLCGIFLSYFLLNPSIRNTNTQIANETKKENIISSSNQDINHPNSSGTNRTIPAKQSGLNLEFDSSSKMGAADHNTSGQTHINVNEKNTLYKDSSAPIHNKSASEVESSQKAMPKLVNNKLESSVNFTSRKSSKSESAQTKKGINFSNKNANKMDFSKKSETKENHELVFSSKQPNDKSVSVYKQVKTQMQLERNSNGLHQDEIREMSPQQNEKEEYFSEKNDQTQKETKSDDKVNDQNTLVENKPEIKAETTIGSDLKQGLSTDSVKTLMNQTNDKTIGKGIVKPDSIDSKKSNLAESNMTPTLTSEKETSYFSLSTEVIFSTINYSAKPNTSAGSQFDQNGFQQLYANGQTGNNNHLFNGAAILSYNHKSGIGFNIGMGFFNVETKIDSKAFAQTKTQTIFDHYTYDSLHHIIDTVYKPGAVRQVIVVNGDTVDAQSYLNNIRFVTIPLSFNYKIKITKKFAFIPQGGIQFAIPLNSYQLVAIKPNVYEYSKSKLFLNPHLIFFDLAIKLNYKLGANANLYLKQGYFFNNKSIYTNDYALNFKLNNVYTSFGITIDLK